MRNLKILTYFCASFVLSALAKSTDGDFAVTINGQTFNPPEGDEIKLDKQNTVVNGPILFRGIHVNFDVDVASLAVQRYTFTAASHPPRIVNRTTEVFASKTPGLTASQRANPRLTRLEVKDDKVVLIIEVSGGKYKIQAIDTAQGGALQTETEFDAGAVEWTHILGADVFYFLNEVTGKINMGNGLDAVTPAQDPVGFHEMFFGKDSPEAATQTFQDGTTSKWLIQPGGRVGAVFGHDAIEQSPGGASNCTSQCQNRNRIRGSLPIPPALTSITPLGSMQTPAAR